MISYDAAAQTITLQTARSTYQMKIDSYGVLLHTYYGPKIKDGDMSNIIGYHDRGFSPNPNEADGGRRRGYSLDTLPQELGSSGVGDFRISSIELEAANGGYAADFRYVRHEIRDGKYALEGLPAFYATDAVPAQTLQITMRDSCVQVEVDLLYGVFEETDLITRAMLVRNAGSEPVQLRRAMSLCLDIPRADLDLLTFNGAYGRERALARGPLLPGCQSIESVRGTSSHQHNPFFILSDHRTTEDTGSCLGIALVYSGNFIASTEYTQLEETRAVMGIHPFHFAFRLEPGQSFTTPEAAMIYSGQGLTRLSQQFHRAIRGNLCRGVWKDRPRPIVINNWEATEFNFNAEKIIAIAEKAAQVGIEMLVLDDGWYGHRNNDFGGLGDWHVNEEKLPGGLPPLVEKIKSLGMKFGIWIEPEMISEDSDLYQQHPDWAFYIPGRPPTRGRSQLILDLTREDVQEFTCGWLGDLLRSADISCVKWDMNRSMSNAWSGALPAERQGEVYHRYILGLYRIMEWVHQTFPHVLIEGCAGGGGRFDCGILYYAPQIWCSDNTDALDRTWIQYGTSFCYPASATGAHVSAVPNGLTGRSAPMHTRGAVAMNGVFGYELDLNLLSPAELEVVQEQVRLYKEYRDIILFGDYYRLTNPFERIQYLANLFVTPDQTRALLTIVQKTIHANPILPILKLKGLNPDALYRLGENTFRGDQLMYSGIPCPLLREYEAAQLYLEQIN